MGQSLIDPQRSVVVERPKPRIETANAVVRTSATDWPAPSRFPTGSARFGDASPGVVKRLASDSIVEFFPANTRHVPPTGRSRYEATAKASRISLTVLALSLLVALVTCVVFRIVATW